MSSEKEAASVPLSDQAQEAKELMQQQLVRKMAVKMIAEAEEQERQRRIQEATDGEVTGDAVRQRALDQIIAVQEDLVRVLNRMKVKEAEELEQAQRVTQDKKHAVHDELIRKATAKEVEHQVEEERSRLIKESKNPSSPLNIERNKTYDKLVLVQEQLLHHVLSLKVNEATKEEQQRRITEDTKLVVQEELVHKVGKKQAVAAQEEERERRIQETQHLTEEETRRRLDIAEKLLNVQKELLATHPPTQAIHGTLPQQVLEDAKIFMQEELIRKAAQKSVDQAMDEEQKRRVAEASNPEAGKDAPFSDAKSDVLSEISRKASIKKAKQLAEATQQQYIVAERKARSEEETVRKIHQRQADKAMEEEQRQRIEEMKGQPPHHVPNNLKKEITEHAQKQ